MREFAARWRWELLLAAILVVVVCVNVSISPFYLGEQNFVNMFQLSIEKLIVVVAMTFVIINGEIDLSVASVMGFSACVLAALHEGGSVPFELAVVIALLAGLGAGLLQGAFVAFMGLPSLVVTLAGLIFFRGAARILVEDRSIGGFPDWFDRLGQEPVLGRITFAVILFVVGMVVAGIVLHRTSTGRSIYVIGNNANVARYSGLNVARTKLALFADLRPGRRSRRRPVLVAPRLCPRRPRARLRAGHHHHRPPRRGQHLRRLRDDDRRRARRPHRRQPPQRPRPREHRPERPDRE